MAKRRGRGEGSISYRKDRRIWQGVLTIGYDDRGRRKRRVIYGRTKQDVQDKMTRLQGWGLALAGSILAMIPCGSCCCFTLPFGIWALVVLVNKDVKAGFQAVAGS